MRKLLLVALLTFAGFAAPVAAQETVTSCIQPASGIGSCATNLTPSGVSTAAESSHLVSSSAGLLSGFQANNFSTSTGLTVMALDASAVPANGTLATCTGTGAQTNPCIMKWYGLPEAASSAQPATIAASWAPGPFLHFLNGLVFVCSSTGPTTLTLSANCTFSADIR